MEKTFEDYEIIQKIHIGDREVVLGVADKDVEYPFMVSYLNYNNPFGVAWPEESIGTDEYLEAMSIFTNRVGLQIEKVREEYSQFDSADKTLTREHCLNTIYDENFEGNIVGKVVVLNPDYLRYEYQHPTHQLILVTGGFGAVGGRGNAVYGIQLATGKEFRWERYEVIGEIKPECMPEWAKKALANIKEKEKEVTRDSKKQAEKERTRRRTLGGIGMDWPVYDKYEKIFEKYVPERGEGETHSSQAATAVFKLLYEYYNNGGVFDNTYGLKGWCNNYSCFANWLRKYESAGFILDKIKDTEDMGQYEELLDELAEFVLDEEKLELFDSKLSKGGSIYDCDGPFQHITRYEDIYEDFDEEL